MSRSGEDLTKRLLVSLKQYGFRNDLHTHWDIANHIKVSLVTIVTLLVTMVTLLVTMVTLLVTIVTLLVTIVTLLVTKVTLLVTKRLLVSLKQYGFRNDLHTIGILLIILKLV